MIPFTDEEIYEAVQNNIPNVSTYVSSHGGGITLLGVKDGLVYIELIGTCSGCAMSLMTTKMVVEKELRVLIHPELELINVDGTPENTVPEDVYIKKVEEAKKDEVIYQEGMFEKVKSFLHI